MSGRPDLPRLPRRARRPAAVAVVTALLLAMVGASMANASALTLATRLKPFSTSQSRCTSQTVAVTNAATSNTTSSLVVSNLDTAGCAGRPLVVTVYDPTVTTWPAARRLVASGTVTTATATLTAATGTFTPSTGLRVHVTIGGWQVPATWTSTAPVPLLSCTVLGTPTATCTATVTGGSQWGYPTTSDYLGTVQITTTSSTPVRWQVTMNLSDATLPFLADALQDTQGGLVLVGTSGCTASPRTVTVRGTTAWGTYDTVSAGQSRSLQVHGFSTNQATPMLLNCP